LTWSFLRLQGRAGTGSNDCDREEARLQARIQDCPEALDETHHINLHCGDVVLNRAWLTVDRDFEINRIAPK
jgi:hypothetical protein